MEEPANGNYSQHSNNCNKGNKDKASKVGMANKEATSREVTGSKVNKARDGDKTKDGECELTHMNT